MFLFCACLVLANIPFSPAWSHPLSQSQAPLLGVPNASTELVWVAGNVISSEPQEAVGWETLSDGISKPSQSWKGREEFAESWPACS